MMNYNRFKYSIFNTFFKRQELDLSYRDIRKYPSDCNQTVLLELETL